MWKNWAGDQTCSPVEALAPADTAAVAAAVERAAAAGRTVRVAGAGHSFSDAVLTDGTLLSLRAMDRVLDVDAAAGLARVQAGIRLHDLTRILRTHGLALPNLGDVDAQHLGGAIATATHGTGIRRHNVSAQVAAAQVVTGSGEVREIDDGDQLKAVRVNLGALGVVTELTLRCVPAFNLHGADRREPLDDVLAALDERADGAEFFELYTFPHSPWALTRTNTVTDAPPEDKRLGFGQVWVDNVAFELTNRASRRVPRLIPALNRFAGRVVATRDHVAAAHEVFASPRLVRFTEMEYALPRAQAVEAVREVKAILERHPVSFPIEVRFLGGDDALLSTAHGRDSVYIATHLYRGMAYEAPMREVERALLARDGRPHWGKRSFTDAGTLAPRYPRWDDFQAVRDELDPERVFENAYTRRLLTESSVPHPGTSAPAR